MDGDVVALDCALLLGLNPILGSFSLRKFLSCNGFERVVCYLLSCLLLLVVQKIFVDISISHGYVLKLFLKERERLGAANGISVKFFLIGFCFYGFMCSPCQLPQRCGTKLAAVHAGRRLQSEIMPLSIGITENRQNISHKIKSGFPLKLRI